MEENEKTALEKLIKTVRELRTTIILFAIFYLINNFIINSRIDFVENLFIRLFNVLQLFNILH